MLRYFEKILCVQLSCQCTNPPPEGLPSAPPHRGDCSPRWEPHRSHRNRFVIADPCDTLDVRYAASVQDLIGLCISDACPILMLQAVELDLDFTGSSNLNVLHDEDLQKKGRCGVWEAFRFPLPYKYKYTGSNKYVKRFTMIIFFFYLLCKYHANLHTPHRRGAPGPPHYRGVS